jgi:hypothetical protein
VSKFRFLNLNSPEWLQTLSHCEHDVYHLPEYASLEAKWIRAEAIAFHYEAAESQMLLPLLVRPTPAGFGLDAVTPYGYSSPVFSRGATSDFRAAALEQFHVAAIEKGIISTFVRLHPLLFPDLPSLSPSLQRDWNAVERGITATMPIQLTEEEWFKGLAGGHRAGIRKLLRAGCTVEIDTDRAWKSFPEIYRQTMQRVGAAAAYFYSDEYVANFRDSLGYATRCVAVLSADGDVMATGLFTHVSETLQYHLSGTAEPFLTMAPMKLLLYGAWKWAAENNVKSFHLGGGLGSKRDSLFEFKSQFGGKEIAFRTVSIVHDRKSFLAECNSWLSKSEQQLAPPDGFFPPYRAPISVKSPEKVE